MIRMYSSDSNDKILDKLKQLCSNTKHSITDFCFQYVMMQDFPSIPIASFSNDIQLEACMKCVDLKLDKELIDSVSRYKELQ